MHKPRKSVVLAVLLPWAYAAPRKTGRRQGEHGGDAMSPSACTRPRPTRRSVLISAAVGSAAAMAAPFVRHSYAAGTLSLGAVDHWVPDANNALTALCHEVGRQ